MAPLLLWTAVVAVFSTAGSPSVTAMPMLSEGERLSIPPSVLEWYLQQRDLQLRGDPEMVPDQSQPQPQSQSQLQSREMHQFKQWLDSQLARLPVAEAEAEEPSKALVPQQPKRGNYMALCHFKICNMGRKRSARIQPQDLP